MKSPIRSLLVHVNDATVSRHAMEVAAALAGSLGARLTVLMAAGPINAGVGMSAETAALARKLEHEKRRELQAIGEGLVAELALQDRDVQLLMVPGDAVDALLDRARTADLVIAGQQESKGEGGLPTGMAARLLVGAGCPVLMVPHIGWSADGPAQSPLLRRALVAWSDSRESARALSDAIPLLQRATYVDLVTFAGPTTAQVQAKRESLDSVVAYLALHDITATPSVLNQGDPSLGERLRRGFVPDVAIGEALLSRAADVHADFMVMGSYGHPRVWELVLGGVTRSILNTMTVPVFMSH